MSRSSRDPGTPQSAPPNLQHFLWWQSIRLNKHSSFTIFIWWIHPQWCPGPPNGAPPTYTEKDFVWYRSRSIRLNLYSSLTAFSEWIDIIIYIVSRICSRESGLVNFATTASTLISFLCISGVGDVGRWSRLVVVTKETVQTRLIVGNNHPLMRSERSEV